MFIFRFRMEDLYQKSMRYLKENACEVLQTSEFVEDLSRDALMTLLQSYDLLCEEVDLFKGVVRWGQQRMKENAEVKNIL